MNFLLNFNWISLFALAIAVIVFAILTLLSKKINWTWVILIALGLGIAFGILFSSDNSSYLLWTDLLGSIYISLISALVAPVILLSIISCFISLKEGRSIKIIGISSVVWLMLAAAAAIVLSIVFGSIIFPLVGGAESVFSGIDSVSEATVNAYKGLTSGLHLLLHILELLKRKEKKNYPRLKTSLRRLKK